MAQPLANTVEYTTQDRLEQTCNLIVDRTQARPRMGLAASWLGHCPCPAHKHGDRKESLSIALYDDKILLFCFATGRKGSDLVEYLDLTINDLFDSAHATIEPIRAKVTVEMLAAHKHIPADFLEAIGLRNSKGVVIVPYCDNQSNVQQLCERRGLAGNTMKRPAGGKTIPYGLDVLSMARQQKNLIIVEGESDCWTLWYHNIPALGIPGASNYKTLQKSHLQDIDSVYIAQENDDAGAKFAANMSAHIVQMDFQGDVFIMTMPDGHKDISDLYASDIAHFMERMSELKTASEVDIDTDAVCLGDVQSEEIDWLEEGHLAYGKITLIDGDAEQGKSVVYEADYAARITTGSIMPSGGVRRIPQNVLIVSTEDGRCDTVRPRIEAAGGDVRRVWVKEELSIPSGISKLERLIKRKDIKYLVISPIMGCLDVGTKTGDDASVRRALQPLKKMVERLHIVCVMIRHNSKGVGLNAMSQGGGSVAFGAVARIGAMVAPDPGDDECKVLAVAKCNIGRKMPAQRYRIRINERKLPYVQWLGASALAADDLTKVDSTDNKTRKAILDFLKGSPDALFGPKQIAEEIGEPVPNVTNILRRLNKTGVIVNPARGQYKYQITTLETLETLVSSPQQGSSHSNVCFVALETLESTAETNDSNVSNVSNATFPISDFAANIAPSSVDAVTMNVTTQPLENYKNVLCGKGGYHRITAGPRSDSIQCEKCLNGWYMAESKVNV